MIYNNVRELIGAMAKNSQIAPSLAGSSQELNPWRSICVSSGAETESTIVIDPPGSDSRVKGIVSASQSEGGDMYSAWKRKVDVVQNSSLGDPQKKLFKSKKTTDLDTQPLSPEQKLLDQYSGREFEFFTSRWAERRVWHFLS